MARDYGKIRSQFWNDERVKGWSLELKGFATYMMTCEHATALGAFRLPPAYISDDLDITPAKARLLLAELEASGFVAVCPQSGWVWLRKFLRHNKPEGANVWKHVRALAAAIPANVTFRTEVVASIPDSSGPKEVTLTQSEPSSNLVRTESEPTEGICVRTEPEPEPEPSLTEPEPEPSSVRASAPRRGIRIPDDWQPSETDRAYAAGKGFSPAQIDKAAEEFRNYWLSATGAHATKLGDLGWSRTWQNRVTTLVDQGWLAKAGRLNGAPTPERKVSATTGIAYVKNRAGEWIQDMGMA